MANHGRAYGMSADIKRKQAAKYSVEMEVEAAVWLEVLADTRLDGPFAEELKDGTVLCKAMNALSPGAIPKINASKLAFKQMENIGNFLAAAEAYGVARGDLFQTVDLYEAKNMLLVVDGIHALGRAAQKNNFDGPVIGAKESAENKRDFSQEVLQAGAAVIPAQAGFTKGANQSGMTFGTGRQIDQHAAKE